MASGPPPITPEYPSQPQSPVPAPDEKLPVEPDIDDPAISDSPTTEPD